jgi:hypothetical protein
MSLTLNAVADGYQVMKYTYDTFTQLRSSIDMPKEWVLLPYAFEG